MAKFIKTLGKLEDLLMIFGIVLAVCLIFLQVILRYLFHASLPWIEEAARYLFVYFTWIGASAAASSDRHIRVEILYNKFPKAKKYLVVVGAIVCLAMSLFMLIYGMDLIQNMRRFSALSPTMKIPMWICYMAIPIGGLLLSIKYAYNLFAIHLKQLKKGVE